MGKKITVSYDVANDELIMSDRGHTNAMRSEVIHWHPGDNVESITNVIKKPDSPISTEKFWEDAPHPNGKKFMGKINSDLKDGDSWDYDITCNVGTQNGPVEKTKDPRIQVQARDESSES
jgi:hypothetical protein